MNRFDEMNYLFNERKLFKLVCGAGNEDAVEVKKLVFIYALAGAKLFDVSANVEVVKHAVMGIDEAVVYTSKINRKIDIRPYINVSIGMRGDPHVRKAKVEDTCIKCGACINACPQDAISDEFFVIEKKCIGCGCCEVVCPNNSISFYHKNKNLKQLLVDCKNAGMEQLELHAAVVDSDSIFEEWKIINEVISDNYVSMCIDRFHLGNTQFVDRIRRAKEIAGKRFIVQADGIPMSGGKDDYNTTLQAIAAADVVMKSGIDVVVLLSGGTNSLTAKFANMCGVDFDGVAIGTFARNLIKSLISDEKFLEDDDKIHQAVAIAHKLVTDNIGEPIW